MNRGSSETGVPALPLSLHSMCRGLDNAVRKDENNRGLVLLTLRANSHNIYADDTMILDGSELFSSKILYVLDILSQPHLD